jgi:cytochrome c2
MKPYMSIVASVISLFALHITASLAKEEEGATVAAATDKQYIQECSACHMAYPPGLLPARSWEKLLSNLGDHFGENAELGADAVQSIKAYLAKNAADKVANSLSRNFARSIGAATPLRISEVPYFKREHREVSSRMVEDNPQVKSFSRCEVCHTRAPQGSFNENEVNIPGYGRGEREDERERD